MSPQSALVLQGGGMRGVYSAAVLSALEEAGLRGAFSHVVGASAGAFNGAYFLAGQIRTGTQVYVYDLSNRRFVNFLRWSKIVDIDFLIDDIVKGSRILDLQTLLESPAVLHIALTLFPSAEPFLVTNRDSNIDLIEALRATAALPLFYGRVVTLAGRSCVDGAVSNAIPLSTALDLGCTRVLAVLTRPPEKRELSARLADGALRMPFVVRLPIQEWHRAITSASRLDDALCTIRNQTPANGQVVIDAIFPSRADWVVGQTTTDPHRLRRCALMGYNDARAWLGLEKVTHLAWL